MARQDKTKGSALLLAVVLTSLLAIMGVMFLVVARLNSHSSTAVSEARQFDHAIESVVSLISHELVMDTPGVNPDTEYYDYPGDNDPWLASIEPRLDPDPADPDKFGEADYWPQITDLTGYIERNYGREGRTRVSLKPEGLTATKFLHEYPEFSYDYVNKRIVRSNGNAAPKGIAADASGDGIADSKWIELPNVRTGRGEPIFAAIRIIDNSGLINVNTAFAFDPNSYEHFRLDGTRQYQIDLAGLKKGGSAEREAFLETLVQARENRDDITEPTGFESYNEYFTNYVRSFNPTRNFGSQTPFDISDEIELRYKHLLDSYSTTRLEEIWPELQGTGRRDFEPFSGLRNDGRWSDWADKITSPSDGNPNERMDRRRLLTTHNADRLIAPDGWPQYNIRKTVGDPYYNIRQMDNAELERFYEFLCEEIIEEADISAADKATLEDELAQVVVNLKDYMDYTTSELSVVRSRSGQEFYGFKRPLMYISEVATNYAFVPDDPAEPEGEGTDHFSLAIEVMQRHPHHRAQDWEFRLNVFRGEVSSEDPNEINEVVPLYMIDVKPAGFRGSFFVYLYEDPEAPFSDIRYSDTPFDGATGVVPEDVVLRWEKHFRLPDAVFDLYLGTERDSVADANELNPDNLILHRTNERSFAPFAHGLLDYETEYFWRVDHINPDNELEYPENIYRRGSVLSFTTGDENPDPNGIEIDPESWEFNENTVIRLERWVEDPAAGAGDWIPVDEVAFLPEWLFESDPNRTSEEIRSFKRDIRRNYCLKGYWDWPGDPNYAYDHSLGNSFEHYETESGLPMRDYPRQFNTVGDIASVFRVNAYSIPGNPRFDIYDEDFEKQVRFDLRNPHLQKIFKYITNWQALNSEPDELRMKGRININTAPRFVIEQLPWVSLRENHPEGRNNRLDNRHALAEAIVAYRDKLPITGVDITYEDPLDGDENVLSGRYDMIRFAIDELGLFAEDVREAPGFESIGELNFVINEFNDDSSKEYNIAYYGLDGHDQIGPPDLTYYTSSGRDGITDDFKERDLIFARISDLVTVRSDVFTAYILLRLGPNGPQRRYMALLDRSNVRSANDKVQVLYLQPVSPHWSKD